MYDDHFEITGPEEKWEVRSEESDSGDWWLVSGNLYKFPNIELKVPGKHILRDAHLAYIVGKLLQVPEEFLVKALESYSWAWRRMEVVGQTSGWNTLMSDYGHHPTEIELTLPAIQERYPDKHLYVIFQPHQYSRTIELLEGFKTCFDDVDTLVISDIYYSRDKQEDVDAMPPEKLVEELRERYPDPIDGQGLENTAKIIKEHDRENDGVIYLLLGAGDVDNLRYKLLG